MAKSKNTVRRRKAWSKQRLLITIQDFFLLSERERRGLRAMMFLIVILWAVRFLLMPALPGRKLQVSVLDREIISVQKRVWEQERDQSARRYDTDVSPTVISVERNFDPNSVSAADLISMGFPEKLSRRWEKYIQSGGKFRKPADLLKLYGFEAEWLPMIEGFLVLRSAETESIKPSYKAPAGMLLELNRADSAQLCALPGVGPFLASRIMKYRSVLGGFYNKDQLLEVYGMDSLRFQKFQHLLTVDTALVLRLSMDSTDFRTLSRHPAIGRDLAYEIVEARRVKGRLLNLDQVEAFRVKPEPEQRRIRSYLRN